MELESRTLDRTLVFFNPKKCDEQNERERDSKMKGNAKIELQNKFQKNLSKFIDYIRIRSNMYVMHINVCYLQILRSINTLIITI